MGKTGDHAQALQLIEEALAEGNRSGEGAYEMEAWRLKGELLLARTGKSQKSQDKGQKRGENKNRGNERGGKSPGAIPHPKLR